MNTWLVGLLLVTARCSCVEILSLSVPGVVEAGADDVVLDCDFNYTEEEKNHLSIMWYFDNEPEPEPEQLIYMWLPGVEESNEPKVISDMFREHLDLGFAVNQEPFSKHRALHIKNPTPKLSGSYRCKVSTLTDEDVQQKDLLVYSPPSSIEFDEFKVSDSAPFNVTCMASGMYPKPEARLTWRQNSSKIEQETTSSVIHKREDGLFDVTLSTTIDNDSLSLQVTTIDCEVFLSGTEYSILQQAVLYPEGMEPPPTEESSTTEEPTTIELLVTTETPVTTEEPSTTEESASTEDPATTEEPTPTEESVTTDDPILILEESDEESMTTQEPAITEDAEAATTGVRVNDCLLDDDENGAACLEGTESQTDNSVRRLHSSVTALLTLVLVAVLH